MKVLSFGGSALVLLALCVLGGSCGGEKSGFTTQPAAITAAPSLDELQTVLAGELDRLGVDPTRAAAKAPGGGNAVFDLTAALIDPDGAGPAPPTHVELSWTERLVGDYDLNGEVNAADLVPIARHFGETVIYDAPLLHGGLEGWPAGDPEDEGSGAENWCKARIDGDLSGEIGIGDVTPIALHWLEQLSGYRVYRRVDNGAWELMPDPADPASLLSVDRASALPAEPSAPAPVRYGYSDALEAPQLREYYVAGLSPLGEEGVQSRAAVVDANAPPSAQLTAEPASGVAPLSVAFDAAGSFDSFGEIVNFEWDLDGDGAFDELEGGEHGFEGLGAAQYTYETPGAYTAAVRVVDGSGATDTAGVLIAAYPAHGSWAYLTVEPVFGMVPLEVTLDASQSVSVDGSIVLFEWDFDGDGGFDLGSGATPAVEHTYDISGWFEPAVRVTDSTGAMASASASLVVWPLGYNLPPVAQLAAEPLEGDSPLTVAFSSAGSYDPDGVDYELIYAWDLDGDGSFEQGYGGERPHTYHEPGSHTASLRVTDPQGSWSTDDVSVTVHVAFGAARWHVNDVPYAREYSDMTLDCALMEVGGAPAVAYIGEHASGHPYAGFVRARSATGSSWLPYVNVHGPAHIDQGEHARAIRLALVDGRPAIACQDYVTGYLRYSVAYSAEGGTWGYPAEVYEEECRLGSLVVADGKPALCFTSDDRAYFVRAEDDEGALWGTPVVVYEGAGVDGGGDLAVVGGLPAMCFWQGGGFYYTRALDPAGETWDTPWLIRDFQSLDTLSNRHYSLTAADDAPLLCYWTPEGAIYHKGPAETGGTWSEQVVVGENSVELVWIGQQCSLDLAAGMPAVAFNRHYYHQYQLGGSGGAWLSQVVYRAATDSEGTSAGSWGEEQVLASSLASGPVFAEIAGRPAVCFVVQHSWGSSLKFAVLY